MLLNPTFAGMRSQETYLMGRFDRLRRKPKEKKPEKTATQPTTVSKLERVCGEDKEAYKALFNTMLLEPKRIDISMKDAAENAKKAEKEKDAIRAAFMYRIAGGLAIYEGNVDKVVEYFSQAQRLQPNEEFPILKSAEKAVQKAQECYKQLSLA